MSNFFSKYFYSSANLSAASQTSLVIPPMQLRIDDTSLESFSDITLDINSDDSWDFGQSISTWQQIGRASCRERV